jgi:hypothetical protein
MPKNPLLRFRPFQEFIGARRTHQTQIRQCKKGRPTNIQVVIDGAEMRVEMRDYQNLLMDSTIIPAP